MDGGFCQLINVNQEMLHKASDEIPLISFEYQGKGLFICPQHLPILIHDPTKLAEVLPGADSFRDVTPKE